MRRNFREVCCHYTNSIADFSVGEVCAVHFDGQAVDFPKSASEVRAHLLLSEDIYRFLRAYAKEVSAIAERESFDVFRLPDFDALWNQDYALFDPSDRRYLGSVLEATDVLLQKDVIFEVRVTAKQKGSVPILYPSLLSLRRIGEKRGRVMLSSDDVPSEQIGTAIRDAIAMLRACGIGCVYVRKNGAWMCIPI